MASSRNEKRMLNAGRGNPNWVALEPRHAFFQLGHFAVAESERYLIRPGIGTVPNSDGIASRFDDLYTALGISAPDTPLNAHYYATIDVPQLASERYGSDF